MDKDQIRRMITKKCRKVDIEISQLALSQPFELPLHKTVMSARVPRASRLLLLFVHCAELYWVGV